MGKDSGIEWTHHTFNPWHGCMKVSEGCKHCYAETLSKRWGKNIWGPDTDRQMMSESYWKQLARWNKEAEQKGERKRVFVASMADIFEDHPQVIETRARMMALIPTLTWLDFLLLTKRPKNVLEMVPDSWHEGFPPNVWMGTSVENQEHADKRIPALLGLPATVRFLSCEPLLGPLNLSVWLYTHRCSCEWQGTEDDLVPDAENETDLCPDCGSPEVAPRYHFLWGEGDWGEAERRLHAGLPTPIDWVIVGGESGHGARPMHPDWARSLKNQCQAAGVAFFFKQWGAFVPNRQIAPPGGWPTGPNDSICLDPEAREQTFKDGQVMRRVGKTAAGRELDGRTWDEFPQMEMSQ